MALRKSGSKRKVFEKNLKPSNLTPKNLEKEEQAKPSGAKKGNNNGHSEGAPGRLSRLNV